MNMVLQVLHKQACTTGENLMRKHNGLSQSFFWILMGDEISIIPTPWNNDFEKQIYIAAMRMLIAERKIEAYSFFTEAWLATVGKHQKELEGIPPSERSDRKDILMVISRHRDGDHCMTQYNVDYDETGKVTLGPAHHVKEEIEGLMGNLFDLEG
jgi:hypothetical protein